MAFAGAKIAIVGVFGYAALVMLYAIIRSSITIYNIMPSGQRKTAKTLRIPKFVKQKIRICDNFQS